MDGYWINAVAALNSEVRKLTANINYMGIGQAIINQF